MRSAITVAGMVLFLACGTLSAKAESLDCGQPSSPLSRLICGDPLLRAADAEESGVYESALLASLDRPSLREEERVWFDHEILPYNWFAQRNAPIDNTKIAEAYRRRSDALRQETRDWRKLRHSVPGATLANTCLAVPQRSGDCTVKAFAPIEGMPTLRYQEQTYAQPAAASVMVIFAAGPERPDEWLPLAVTSSTHTLMPPQAVASPAGTLLVIAGGSDASALYRLDKDALEDIDDRSWLETLRSRLPDGLALSLEIVADYGKMHAIAKVTRSQSTCCVVGSTATIDLSIEDQRVVVSGVTFSGPDGPPNSNQN